MDKMVQKEKLGGMLTGMMTSGIIALIYGIVVGNIIRRYAPSVAIAFFVIACLLAPAITFAYETMLNPGNPCRMERKRSGLITSLVAIIPSIYSVMYWANEMDYSDSPYSEFFEAAFPFVGVLALSAMAAVSVMLLKKAHGRNRRAVLIPIVPLAVAAVILLIVALTQIGYYDGYNTLMVVLMILNAGMVAASVTAKILMKAYAGRPQAYESTCAAIAAQSEILYEGHAWRHADGAHAKGYMFLTGDMLHVKCGGAAPAVSDFTLRLSEIKSIGKISYFKIGLYTNDGRLEYFRVNEADEWITMIKRAAVKANGGRPLQEFAGASPVKLNNSVQ